VRRHECRDLPRQVGCLESSIRPLMNENHAIISDEIALRAAFDAAHHMHMGPHRDEMERALHNIEGGRHTRTSLLAAYLELPHVESLYYRRELLDALNAIKHHLRPLKFT